MSQTAIIYPLQNAFAGMLADVGYLSDVQNAVNADTGNIGFGLVVMKGSADDQVLQFTNAAAPVGVVIHSHAYDNGPNGELDTVTVNSGATIMPGLKPKTLF